MAILHKLIDADRHVLIKNFSNLAEIFGMSKRNFARRFKQATGDIPKDYLQRLRIFIARDLLIYSERSVKYIALEVGYQDSSYFGELFKRFHQMTPSQYRKQFRQQRAI